MSADDVVIVGDRVRFSMQLVKEFYERPHHHSPILEIVRIERAPDGTLEIWLRPADRQT